MLGILIAPVHLKVEFTGSIIFIVRKSIMLGIETEPRRFLLLIGKLAPAYPENC